MRYSTSILLLATLFACGPSTPLSESSTATTARAGEAAAPDDGLHERLREIAAGYEDWGRVDDTMRWVPTLCMAPPPPAARMSTSRDRSTHGSKLYSLFALDRDAYVACAESDQPVGQVLVKESWVPEALPEGTSIPEHYAKSWVQGGANFNPYAEHEGQLFRATGRGPLFVMIKLGPDAPDSDEGWVYGTVTTDGDVTSAGRVESCMDCHVDAPRDRMFGLE